MALSSWHNAIRKGKGKVKPLVNGKGTFTTDSFLTGFPAGVKLKNPLANAGDSSSIPGWGRSPGVGSGNPLQYSCLENSMDRGACGPQSMGSQRVRHDWMNTGESEPGEICWIQPRKEEVSYWLYLHIPTSFLLKERQCQRMIKLLHNCTHLTH